MATTTDTQPATPETVWALLRELAESQKETGRLLKETDRLLTKLGVQIGGISSNQGCFAEEFFYNSFEKGNQNFFGEKFDEIEKEVKGLKKDFRDEYDILLINGQSVGIIEIKYKAHENDLAQVLRKAETFRANFPDYAGHQIYLGLASMAFYPKLEKACTDNGIAIIKQVGDTVVIIDENLKTF
jgi:hypothetical protein